MKLQKQIAVAERRKQESANASRLQQWMDLLQLRMDCTFQKKKKKTYCDEVVRKGVYLIELKSH